MKEQLEQDALYLQKLLDRGDYVSIGDKSKISRELASIKKALKGLK